MYPREDSSVTMHMATLPSPRPPYCSGMVSPNTPASLSFADELPSE